MLQVVSETVLRVVREGVGVLARILPKALSQLIRLNLSGLLVVGFRSVASWVHASWDHSSLARVSIALRCTVQFWAYCGRRLGDLLYLSVTSSIVLLNKTPILVHLRIIADEGRLSVLSIVLGAVP